MENAATALEREGLDVDNVIEWSGRPKRARRPAPLSYWEEYVETDEWYRNKLLEDVPADEMHAACVDEDFEDDECSGDECEEEGEEDEDSIDDDFIPMDIDEVSDATVDSDVSGVEDSEPQETRDAGAD